MGTPTERTTRAIVFDLDGTLVDSMPFVLRAFAHALAPFRPDLTPRDIFARLGGPPLRILREFTGDDTTALAALRRLDACGFQDGGRVAPFPGVREFLDTLRERGVALAVWTGRDRVTTRLILEANALHDHFAVIVCGDDLTTHKPHPEGLVSTLQKLGLPPDEVVYVGDSDVDVLGGHAAGVRTVLIGHGREVEKSVKDKAWRHVGTPAEAYRLLGDGGGE